MKRLICLILLLLPVLAAADPAHSPKELLRLAIERAEAAEPGEGEEEKGDRSEESEDDDPGFPFFDRGFRERHELRFDEWTDFEGREAAAFKVRPLKRKKKEYWKGRILFDADNGALLAYDLEPAKRPFGLKAMRVQVDSSFRDFRLLENEETGGP